MSGKRKVDVLALVVGAGALLIRMTVLWISFGPSLATDFVKVAVPLAFVAVGGLALFASRH